MQPGHKAKAEMKSCRPDNRMEGKKCSRFEFGNFREKNDEWIVVLDK